MAAAHPGDEEHPGRDPDHHDRRADVGLDEHEVSGTSAIAQSLITSWIVGTVCFSSDRLAASITISPSLANSDGVIWKPATSNHRCAPAADEPRNETARAAATAPRRRR